MKLNELSKEQIIKTLQESTSYGEFLTNLGYSQSGNAYKFTKKYLDSIGVNYNVFTKKTWSNAELSNEEVFKINNPFDNKALKTKILKHKLLVYECAECNNTGEWNGKILSLHLDHINGDNKDNRLENLRFLCPNCHSQTPTYAGKNNKMLP
jgi:Zn finger protein HypA/HybF involved in hydrogenase expression